MTTLKLLFSGKIEIVRQQHAVNPYYLVRVIKLSIFLTSTARSSSISHIHHMSLGKQVISAQDQPFFGVRIKTLKMSPACCSADCRGPLAAYAQ